jgi:hypothetical protein
MLNTIFSIALLIGGTVLAFQFILMFLGGGDEGGDLAGADGAGLEGIDAGFEGVDGGFDASAADTHAGGHANAWTHAADADLGHPGAHWFYEVLSLRTLSAALTFFGIAGKMSLAYGYSNPSAFAVATLVGAAAMYGVYWMFIQVYKLQHAGNENVRNAIGLPATVYVPVPGKRAGAGKVTFKLQNRLVEYQAVTEYDDRLATGEKVIIVGVVNSDTVRVKRDAAPTVVENKNNQERTTITS